MLGFVTAYLFVGLAYGFGMALVADAEFHFSGNGMRLRHLLHNGWKSSAFCVVAGALFWLPLMLIYFLTTHRHAPSAPSRCPGRR